MAKINDDDENEPVNMFRAAPQMASGGGYSGGSKANQAPQQSTGRGTGFRNIQDWLTGSSQAGELISGAESMGQSTLGKIGEFQSGAEKMTAVPEFDPNVAGGWLYDVAPGQNTDKQATFSGKVPTGYSGPADYTGMPNWLETSQEAEKTAQKTGRLGDFTGIQQAVSENRGPVWTKGMSKSATVNVMADPRYGQLQEQKEKWSGIKDILGKAETDVQGNIQRAQQNTQAWQNAAQMAKEKAADTNKWREERAAKQGPGVAEYTAPAVVPAPAPAPAAAPAPTQQGRPANPIENFVLDYLVPSRYAAAPSIKQGFQQLTNPVYAPASPAMEPRNWSYKGKKLPKYL